MDITIVNKYLKSKLDTIMIILQIYGIKFSFIFRIKCLVTWNEICIYVSQMHSGPPTSALGYGWAVLKFCKQYHSGVGWLN